MYKHIHSHFSFLSWFDLITKIQFKIRFLPFYHTIAILKVSLEFRHRINDNTDKYASQIILSSVLQFTRHTIALTGLYSRVSFDLYECFLFSRSLYLLCLLLKHLVNTCKTPQDCVLFIGVRNYTSGYMQFFARFLRPKTS